MLGEAHSATSVQAIDITLRHDQWIAEYTEKSTALRDFCENTREYYGSRDHGNTAAAVKEALDAFNSYKSETKPEWKAQLTQLEGVFNTFTTSCRNNNRPVYVPEAGKDISTLQSMWAVRFASARACAVPPCVTPPLTQACAHHLFACV